MNYHGKIEETDTLIGNMGLGVDYYKGEKGIPGKDGKDGSDQVYVGADEPTDERVKLWIDTDATPSSGGAADSIDWSKVQNKPNFADVATSGDYNDLSNKPTIPSVEGLASEAYVNEKVAAIVIPEVPTKVSELENDKGYLTEHQSLAEYAKKTEIPAPYTLPTASTSTLGGVKVDGNTITIADGVISAKSGGSSGGGGSEWIYTANKTESGLYNAKELVIFVLQTSQKKFYCDHYIFVKQDGTQGTLGADFSKQWFGMFFSNSALWQYNGSTLEIYNYSYNWLAFAYKT